MRRSKITDEERIAFIHREIVYQALRDLLLRGEAGPDDRAVARRWLFAEGRDVGSLHWCCELGGLDAAEVREAVRVRGK